MAEFAFDASPIWFEVILAPYSQAISMLPFFAR